MRWAVRQLASPLRYLRIEQGRGLLHSKRTYDFVIPGLVGVLAALGSNRLSLHFRFFSGEGLAADIISLLNLLIAFFIAALAAVATFDRPGLDETMKGDPAILRRKNRRAVTVELALTHRQFVCYLFGYLSFASIGLLLVLYMLRMFEGPLRDLMQVADWIEKAAKPAFVFLFFGALAQLIVTMLLGIHFLCDRLQFLDDPTI